MPQAPVEGPGSQLGFQVERPAHEPSDAGDAEPSSSQPGPGPGEHLTDRPGRRTGDPASTP